MQVSNYYKDEVSLEVLSKIMPEAFLWKKNLDSVYTEINQDCAELFGIDRKKDITGLTDYEIPCKISEFAETFQKQDQLVISSGKSIKILEIHVCSKDQLRVMINTKNPLRDKNDKLIGTFAYCLDITKQLGLSLDKPTKITSGSYLLENGNLSNLLKNCKLWHEQTEMAIDNKLNLTSREKACLFHLVKGKTAQETGDLLFISKRTVEKHIENIKFKFQCKTKSQLIHKAISCNFF